MSDVINFDPEQGAPPKAEVELAERRAISVRRIAGAFGIALLVAFASWGLAAALPSEGQAFVGVAFLFIQPAALCAFIAYVADPMREKPYRSYMMVPMVLTFLAILLGAIFLREGVICILMLSPIWIASGLAGVSILYTMRKKRAEANRLNASVLLMLPLLAIQLESYLPVPVVRDQVVSSVIIDATPQVIWPHLLSIPAISAREGLANLSQDVIGIPRPSNAQVVQTAQGLIRKAEWGPNARFDELITRLEPNRAIDWRFSFPDDSIRRYTDEHIDPAGETMRIETGGYAMQPLAGGKTRLTLYTRYRMKTPLNAYAALWGDFFLGDIQNNVLAIIKDRAED